MSCKKCGKCCSAIWLPVTYSEIIEQDIRAVEYARKVGQKRESDDVSFVLKNFYPITWQEAQRRNPHLKTWPTDRGYFYGCYLFDSKTHRCRQYDSRTRLCMDFPYYTLGKLPSYMYSNRCGYLKVKI